MDGCACFKKEIERLLSVLQKKRLLLKPCNVFWKDIFHNFNNKLPDIWEVTGWTLSPYLLALFTFKSLNFTNHTLPLFLIVKT